MALINNDTAAYHLFGLNRRCIHILVHKYQSPVGYIPIHNGKPFEKLAEWGREYPMLRNLGLSLAWEIILDRCMKAANTDKLSAVKVSIAPSSSD